MTHEDKEERTHYREDQACQGFYCGAAPLGCSDKRYCPGPPRTRARPRSIHVNTDMHTDLNNPLNKWRKQARF